MKKLSLNKQTIALLNRPENILGGLAESYNGNGINTACFVIAHDYSTPGIWKLTEKWNCPSNTPTYCAMQVCDTKQCVPPSCVCADNGNCEIM